MHRLLRIYSLALPGLTLVVARSALSPTFNEYGAGCGGAIGTPSVSNKA